MAFEIYNGVLAKYIEEPGETEVIIPPGVTEIGRYAFEGCQNLESVIIPDGVKTIGTGAFSECRNLRNVYIPDSVTIIDYRAFENSGLTDITIPKGVTKIFDWTFEGCQNLENVTISDGVTEISDKAFMDCSSLTSVAFPDSVQYIGNRAFEGCFNLEGIRFSKGLNEIGRGAFADCCSLTSVDIPDGVKKIGICAFYHCDSLNSVKIADSVKFIGERAFVDCKSLVSVTIPKSVIDIGKKAFSGCENLTNVTIPPNLEIEDDVFEGCNNLLKVNRHRPQVFVMNPDYSLTIMNGEETAFEKTDGGYLVNGQFIDSTTVQGIANIVISESYREDVIQQLTSKYGEDIIEKIPNELLNNIIYNYIGRIEDSELRGILAEEAVRDSSEKIKDCVFAHSDWIREQLYDITGGTMEITLESSSYGDKVPESYILQTFNEYKKEKYQLGDRTFQEYFERKLEEDNFDIIDEMKREIINELYQRAGSPDSAEYRYLKEMEEQGEIFDVLDHAGLEYRIDANSYLKETYHMNLIFNEEALTMLVRQQGHTLEEVDEAVKGEKENDNAFVNSLAKELIGTDCDANYRLTALVSVSDKNLFDVLDSIAKGKNFVSFPNTTQVGLYNKLDGSGSNFTIDLERRVIMPTSMVALQIEGVRSIQFQYALRHALTEQEIKDSRKLNSDEYNSGYTVSEACDIESSAWDKGELTIYKGVERTKDEERQRFPESHDGAEKAEETDKKARKIKGYER